MSAFLAASGILAWEAAAVLGLAYAGWWLRYGRKR